MNTAQAKQLRREFHFDSDADSILLALNRLAADGPGDLSIKEELDLRYSALRALQRTVPSISPQVADIILQQLLPICVRGISDDDDLEERLIFLNFRQLAGEWLNSLDGAVAKDAFTRTVDYLSRALNRGDQSASACWSIAAIGFRADEWVRKLWEMVEREDEDGRELALRTLAALQPPGKERNRCIQIALDWSRHRLSADIATVLATLTDARTLSGLSEAWLSPGAAELEDHADDLLFIFAAIGRGTDDELVVDQAVRAIEELYTRTNGTFGRRLRLAGNCLPELNSPLALQLLVRLLVEGTDRDDHDRWLVMHRLEECYLPRHLAEINVAPELLRQAAEVFCEILQRSGEDSGRNPTFPGDLKRRAVRTALFLGIPDTETWLGSALGEERDLFTQQELLESFAVLRIEPLPEPLPRWITEPRDFGRSPEENGEFWSRLGATRIARSAETWEAFDLLSRPGLSREGGVMVETADALVAAALSTGRVPSQRESVITRLFEGVEQPTTHAQLSASCRALAAVARRGWLHTSAKRLGALLRLEPPISMKPHDRAEVLEAIVALPSSSWTPAILDTIVEWARERSDVLAERAALALIEMNQAAQHTGWLASKLGLTASSEGWTWKAEPPGQLENSVYLIVRLYAKTRQSVTDFTPALCGVITDPRWYVRYDVLAALHHVVLWDRVPLNDRVLEALMVRARTRQSSRNSDSDALRYAAILAPQRFAREPWPEHFGEWLEDSRTGFADAVGEVFAEPALDVEARWLASTHLLLLVGDDSFAVRRAAFRALGKVSPLALFQRCSDYARSGDLRERLLAVEAWVWLPDRPSVVSGRSGPEFLFFDIGDLHQRFLSDRNMRIRDAADAATITRRFHLLAHQYVTRLSAHQPQSNAEMLQVWRTGNALKVVGDDETVHRLRHLLATQELSPSVRYWLVGITKAVDKKWKASASNRPEPFPTKSRGIEVVKCWVENDGKLIQLNCSLWYVGGGSPEDEHGWGGVAVPQDSNHNADFTAQLEADQELTLQLPGRRGGIRVTGVSAGIFSFSGIRDYPGKS